MKRFRLGDFGTKVPCNRKRRDRGACHFGFNVLAIAPALLLLWYFTSRDLYPEPRRLIWFTFALGFGAAAPAALIGEILFFSSR